MVVNCDWLSLSVKINPKSSVSAPSGYRYEKLVGTNVYKSRYILYNQSGAKIMTFCCEPYSSVIPDDIATCQVANPFLYSPDVPLLESLIHSFFEGYFHGVSRWDVCCDFVPTDGEFKTIRKLTSGAQYVSGKSEGSIFWHSEKYKEREVRMAHCLSWGAPTSSLKVKLYNKSLEIDAAHPDRCSKPYILDEWRGFLPCVDKVWRLEFSWTDVNQLAMDDRRLSFGDCFDSDILVRFFSEVKMKRFVVRMNQGRRNGHRNDDEIVPFLPFYPDGCKIRKALPMSERTALDEERAFARHLRMHMEDVSVLCDAMKYASVRSLLCDLAANPIVCSYLDSMCDGSFAMWLERQDARVGDGLFDML